MRKTNNIPFYIVGMILWVGLYIMAEKVIVLEHRIWVLEDQMGTTMNILTDDGHRTVE